VLNLTETSGDFELAGLVWVSGILWVSLVSELDRVGEQEWEMRYFLGVWEVEVSSNVFIEKSWQHRSNISESIFDAEVLQLALVGSFWTVRISQFEVVVSGSGVEDLLVVIKFEFDDVWFGGILALISGSNFDRGPRSIPFQYGGTGPTHRLRLFGASW
jgi:hypothetical protein